ncbi:hypothetical protein CHS0354_008310 [Potamilus streckersoni]|uniref:Uncharacterized protein n=1 Tax=Potamilus streckersoni TaxID=2493646 RepID=A0AAE0VTA1_9BIVA|nr:hypothetical protein CHS0354_008310 [Potamilus streckersoni]
MSLAGSAILPKYHMLKIPVEKEEPLKTQLLYADRFLPRKMKLFSHLYVSNLTYKFVRTTDEYFREKIT